MDIEIRCEKCGEEMPIDDKKSTKNWTVYKAVCKCGGKGKPKIIK